MKRFFWRLIHWRIHNPYPKWFDIFSDRVYGYENAWCEKCETIYWKPIYPKEVYKART